MRVNSSRTFFSYSAIQENPIFSLREIRQSEIRRGAFIEIQQLGHGLFYAFKQRVKRSGFQSNVDVENVEQIVTLSTCTNVKETDRYVIVASLVPVE